MNLHNSPDVFSELIQTTAESYSIPEIYVEKDYWVTKALKRLAESDYAGSVVFKGGTALSKAHGLIRRFSEDIDLAVRCEGLSQSQIKALLKNTETTMSVDFAYQENHARESKHGKIRKTVHAYQTERGDEGFGQVSNHIILEINAFDTPEPSSSMEVCALVQDLLQDRDRTDLIDEHSLSPFMLDVLSVERTLCEKIMGLVRACHEDDAHQALRIRIRHIYDICMIMRDETHSAFVVSKEFPNLIQSVRSSDLERFKDAKQWLDPPIHSALIFSDCAKTWRKLAPEFQGDFRQMLYDDDLPNDEEVIFTFETIGHQLSAIDS